MLELNYSRAMAQQNLSWARLQNSSFSSHSYVGSDSFLLGQKRRIMELFNRDLTLLIIQRKFTISNNCLCGALVGKWS